MSLTHNFHYSHAVGTNGEDMLDQFLDQWFHVTPVSLPLQKVGIDRILHSPAGSAWTCEYKTDTKGHQTGNAFIETISNDRNGKPGWVHTSVADVLIYMLLKTGTGWVLEPATLREHIHRWTSQHPVKTATNSTYHSYGVLVPLDELAPLAVGEVNLPQGTLTWP